MPLRSTIPPQFVTTLVFDVDGTLYEQQALRRAMLLRLLAHAVMQPAGPHGGIATFRALRAYRRAQELLRGAEVNGSIGERQIQLACELTGQSSDVLAAIVDRWMDREPLVVVERFVMPGLRTLLSSAKANGLRLGVLSDYPAEDKLRAMRVAEYFDVVVSAQDAGVNRFKPDPCGLFEALRRLESAPSEAVYIGDRHDVDGSVANAAGVHCVIVDTRVRPRPTDDGRPSAATVASYRELHSLLFPMGSEPPS
jgi:FMN phosphatase YigB (HAD superfamily)